VVLAEHFLAALNRREGTEKRWSDAALLRLRELPWPGNVRELRNVVERAAIMTDHVIGAEDLPVPEGEAAARPAEPGGALRVNVGTSISEVERELILATLEQLAGDKKRAAEVLGISLKTLYNRLAVYGAAAARG
jgi:DNA-binding NtrC family response regulator